METLYKDHGNLIGAAYQFHLRTPELRACRTWNRLHGSTYDPAAVPEDGRKLLSALDFVISRRTFSYKVVWDWRVIDEGSAPIVPEFF